MLINSHTPEAAVLATLWRAARDDQQWEKSFELRRRLVRVVVEPHLARFDGQLMLHYHRFLHMKPTGAHSFAYGSEYVSDTVYWISVGRIDGGTVRYNPTRTRTMGDGDEKRRIRIAPTFDVPIRSERVSLVPRYAPGIHQPYFVVREKKADDASYLPRFSIDVSALGEHLFAMTRGKHDWYTEIELVLGTKAVHAWLAGHGSETTYEELQKRL